MGSKSQTRAYRANTPLPTIENLRCVHYVKSTI